MNLLELVRKHERNALRADVDNAIKITITNIN